MKHILVILILPLLFITNTIAQTIDVPLVDNLSVVDDAKLLIPIGLRYNSDKKIIYVLDDLETIELDSVRSYILKKLKPKADYYLGTAGIEIIADKNISMYDFEIFQEEIRRFGILKVFYVAKTEQLSRKLDRWSTGYFFRLAIHNETKMHGFYSDRNLAYRAQEMLVSIELDRRRSVKNTSSKDQGGISFPPPPPPPPPPPQLPSDIEELKSTVPADTKIIAIKIASKGQYHFDDRKNLSKKKVTQALEKELTDNKCLFVIQKSKEATYDDYVFVLFKIRSILQSLKNELAIAQHGTAYDKLNFKLKREIANKHPYVMIEEHTELNN